MNILIEKVLRELQTGLRAIYSGRLSRLVLFGSYARGDAEPGSDIDVLVVLKPPVYPSEEIKRTIDGVADISLKHNVVVSCVFVSEENYLYKQSPLLLNVRREGISL